MSVLSNNQQEIFKSCEGHVRSIKGTLKWFNASKGYGFMSPDDGSADVLVSQEVIQEYGLKHLRLGTVLNCEIVKSTKGMTATRILNILDNIRTELDHLGHKMNNFTLEKLKLSIVKWYDDRKGYGFCVTHDDSGDVLLSRSVLRQCGIRSIFPGDKIRVNVMDSEKGLIADYVEYV